MQPGLNQRPDLGGRSILELLSNQSCCYNGDLSEDLPIAKSTLSQHLKELKAAGLIQGQIEGPRVKYCISKENWEEARLRFKDILEFHFFIYLLFVVLRMTN
ncbi:MAG TPA: ArsR family transcriptional regulator [Bacteroidetes bacterium]|nr:ArsR family transcriptional regulator [Bacteroidota bacterium]